MSRLCRPTDPFACKREKANISLVLGKKEKEEKEVSPSTEGRIGSGQRDSTKPNPREPTQAANRHTFKTRWKLKYKSSKEGETATRHKLESPENPNHNPNLRWPAQCKHATRIKHLQEPAKQKNYIPATNKYLQNRRKTFTRKYKYKESTVYSSILQRQ